MSAKYCPHCGSQSTIADPREVYVEVGEFFGSLYEEEGDAVKLTCGDCRKEFFVWQGDAKEVT